MRFLTAYFASKNNTTITLTGSKRMQERPIKVLVDALRDLGADISYVKNEGFPPILIKGKDLEKNLVTIKATVSSQYISALMLIAPSLPNGLVINLEGEVTSVPYIEMTLKLLKKVGVSGSFTSNKITIQPTKIIKDCVINVESDWSSASYYYSLVALSENMSITLKNYSENSLQGDSEIVSIYKSLGVETVFNTSDHSIKLTKINSHISNLQLNLINTPDIAQTIAVTCFGLQITCHLKGLKTLKIKETDRLLALKTELNKLGANVEVSEDSFTLFTSEKTNKNIEIETYQDHRMAMAFAPLAIKKQLVISKPEVVTKSYATFWEDFQKTGIYSQLK
jgi:3-phosphoshikimate 1-carboxyvinyltransferase